MGKSACFDLAREYYESDKELEEIDNLSTEEALKQVEKGTESDEPIGLSFATDDHILSFSYNPEDGNWGSLVIWMDNSKDDYNCSGLPTSKVREVIKRYADGKDWAEVLENWEGLDSEELLEKLEELVETTKWGLNTEFGKGQVELKSEKGNQIILEAEKLYTISSSDQHINIDSEDFQAILSQGGTVSITVK